MSSEALENLMTENRRCELYAEAQDDRLGFWAEQARPLDDQPFSDVLDWSKAPFAEWFVGGRL
jgi:acetyl-CoA synthetase